MVRSRVINTFVFMLITILLIPVISSAHIRKYSFSDIKIRKKLVRYELRMTINDLNHIVSMDTNEDGVVDQQEFEGSRNIVDEGLAPWMEGHVQFSNNTFFCKPRYRGFDLIEGNEILIKMLYKCMESVEELKIISTIFREVDAKHMNWTKISFNGEKFEYVFRDGKEEYSVTKRDRGTSFLINAKALALTGFEQIFTGHAYILITLVFILMMHGFLNQIAIFLAFTSGHLLSMFLSLSGFAPNIQGVIIELLIAMSIMYLGMENCFVRKSDKRWLMASLLGSLFGLKVSQFFMDSNISEERMFEALIAYNTGVGIGEALILLSLSPLVIYAARFNWQKNLKRVFSFYAALLACYWFMEKTL